MSAFKKIFGGKKTKKGKDEDSGSNHVDNSEAISHLDESKEQSVSSNVISSTQSMIPEHQLPSQSQSKSHSSYTKDESSSHSHNHKRGSEKLQKKRNSYGMGNVQQMAAMRKQLGLPGAKHSTMGGSQAMNANLEKLKAMSSGGLTDSQNRARSMNMKKQPNKLKDRTKGRESESKTNDEIRRHSMFPKEKGLDNERNKYRSGKKKTDSKKEGRLNKVQYRVKNEIFVLYDYYNPIKIIGSGAYAVVCEAIDTRTGAKVAIKKNKGVFDHITDARRILREIKLLMHFNHQDIIDLIDVIPPDTNEIDTFNDVYLVMPKMETTLAKVIRSKQKLTDRHFQFFIYQMLRGLKYMHSATIIHRDLKPENILINGADCNVKITDFGLARGVCKDDIENPTEYVVTRWYRSPEVMCSAGFYDEKVDIWSVGCIFAELILRRPAFPGQNYLDQLKIIFENLGTPKDLTWIKTPEAKRWVQKLKPHDGKDLSVLFEKASPKALDLLKKMLILDPSKRISAEEAVEHPYLADLHRPSEEIDCPAFDLSFEFEKAIKTKFGVRHMMHDALMEYFKNPRKPNPHRYKKKDKHKSHKQKQGGDSSAKANGSTNDDQKESN